MPRVYSFHLSVRLFVRLFVHSFGRSYLDFSETIAASDLKSSRSRYLMEYMKICEY